MFGLSPAILQFEKDKAKSSQIAELQVRHLFTNQQSR